MFIDKTQQIIMNEIRKIKTKIEMKDREIVKLNKELADLQNSLNKLKK